MLDIDLTFEVVLIANCILHFNTAYFNRRGELVQTRPANARQDARGWFIPDLLSSIPVELILAAGGDISNGRSWFHLVADGIFRTSRFSLVASSSHTAWVHGLHDSNRSVLPWLFYSRYSHVARILAFVSYIVIGAHYVACTLKVLGEQSGRDVPEPLLEYIACLYGALQLLQGESIEISTVGQNIFATFALLVGSIALAIVFGTVAILVSNFNANSTKYQRKMESVHAIMEKQQLPQPVRERIHQYFKHLRREYESLDGEIVAFSKGLSHMLELEVVLYKYMDLILHVPFWRDGSPDFQKQLLLYLHVRVYLPDDSIIRCGEVGDELFMLNRGLCEIEMGPSSYECATDLLEEEILRGTSGSGRHDSAQILRNNVFGKVRAPTTSRQQVG